MRIQGRNLFLMAVLGGLWATHSTLREPEPVVGTGAAVFPGFLGASVSEVEITDAEGASLVLRRQGDDWILPARFDLDAHAFTVKSMLTAVHNVRATQLVSDAPSAREIYGVGEAGTRVVLSGLGDVVLASFVQGREVPTPGSLASTSAGTFLRPADRSAVYRVAGLPPLSVDPDDWLDTRLLHFDPSDVRALRVRRGGAESGLDLRRAEDGWEFGRWSVEESELEFRPVPSGGVDPLLEELSTLYFERAVAAEFGEEWGLGHTPAWSFDIELEQRLSLWIGAPDGDAGRFAARLVNPLKPQVVTLSSGLVESLLASYDRVEAMTIGRDRPADPPR